MFSTEFLAFLAFPFFAFLAFPFFAFLPVALAIAACLETPLIFFFSILEITKLLAAANSLNV